MSNIDELLEIVKHINEKYREIAKITGENFNIFQTLDLRDDELSHSKFIAELINPDGSHGKGNVFLKLFLDIIGVSDIQKFENSKVEKEDRTNFGRIDIIIFGHETQVVIENKIYAGDQEKQLARYKKAYPDADIIYLTLDGREPNEFSTNGEVETKNISYKREIIDWLEQCKEKAVDFPLLRETITQYINILKDLTGQTRRKDMSNEIIESVLKSPENVKSAFEIEANMEGIKRQIVFKHFVPAIGKLAEKFGLTLEQPTSQYCLERYWGFPISNQLLKDNNIRIHFQFNQKNLQSLVCGFAVSAKSKAEAENIYNEKNPPNTLREHLKGLKLGKHESPYWLFYINLYDHLWRDELTDLLFSKDPKIIKECEEKIKYLLGLLEEFKANG